MEALLYIKYNLYMFGEGQWMKSKRLLSKDRPWAVEY